MAVQRRREGQDSVRQHEHVVCVTTVRLRAGCGFLLSDVKGSWMVRDGCV